MLRELLRMADGMLFLDRPMADQGFGDEEWADIAEWLDHWKSVSLVEGWLADNVLLHRDRITPRELDALVARHA